jgi:hypothetical protein
MGGWLGRGLQVAFLSRKSDGASSYIVAYNFTLADMEIKFGISNTFQRVANQGTLDTAGTKKCFKLFRISDKI